MNLGDTFGTAASTVAVAGAAWAIYSRAKATYERTLGSRATLTERLNSLAIGVTDDYVREPFGPPIFVRRVADYLECVYLSKHAWLRVLYTPEKSVATFAVTITDQKYRFTPAHPHVPSVIRTIGGAVCFGSVQEDGLQGRLVSFGMGESRYEEVVGGFNAVGYQYFVYAYCAAGCGHLAGDRLSKLGMPGFRSGIYEPSVRSWDDRQAERLSDFRAETTMNSFALAKGSWDLTAIPCLWTGTWCGSCQPNRGIGWVFDGSAS